MEQRSAIEELVARARASLDRVEPEHLADEVAAGAIPIDICHLEQRQRDGELPGAIIIDGNVLKWRLDPTSISNPLQPTPTFATSWCATRGTARALRRPRYVSLVCIGLPTWWAAFRHCWPRPTNAGAARTHSQPTLSPMSTYSVLPPEVGMFVALPRRHE
jgi:hypothetical protein